MSNGAFEFVYDLVGLLNGLEWPGAAWLIALTVCFTLITFRILKGRR